jgi:hypothetical protein
VVRKVKANTERIDISIFSERVSALDVGSIQLEFGLPLILRSKEKIMKTIKSLCITLLLVLLFSGFASAECNNYYPDDYEGSWYMNANRFLFALTISEVNDVNNVITGQMNQEVITGWVEGDGVIHFRRILSNGIVQHYYGHFLDENHIGGYFTHAGVMYPWCAERQ